MFNSTQIKKFAKEAGIKNWWKKKTGELRTELQTHHNVSNDAELDFTLNGGCIKQLPTFADPKWEGHNNEGCAGHKVDPEVEEQRETEKKERRQRRKPRKVSKGKTDKKPTKKVEGQTTLAEICKSINVEPRIARRKLRNSDLEKPESGWAWSTESEINKVKEIIK